MCIIAYKPNNIDFPSKSILQTCYENNPDGAGFMYAYGGKVYIRKGFISFESFYNALERARKQTGDKIPYVMHFRIATQGFEKTMTHPFPLSQKMSNLKKVHSTCNIGVAHNGIISLTSDGSREYSDTMKFITDYLSCIIQSYAWYKNDRHKQLIERLIGNSRLSILDKNGHCELLGKGWVESEGIYYSNSTYSYKKYVYTPSTNCGVFYNSYKTMKKQIYDEYEKQYNTTTHRYDFKLASCPVTLEYDYSYCSACSNKKTCNRTWYSYDY